MPSEIEPDPRRAVSRARELAGEHGTVLATGSIYLVADLLSAPGARRASRAVNERGPSVIAMIALVAVVVAVVILIFFGIGYALGRAFL